MRMAVSLRVRLNDAERAEVERRYEGARNAETRTRFQMILLSADGKPAAQIGWLVRRSEDTVRRVVWRFLRQGLDGSRVGRRLVGRWRFRRPGRSSYGV